MVNPSLTLDVTQSCSNPCLYHFEFTLTKGCKDIQYGSIAFVLAEGFGAPMNITPANNPNMNQAPQLALYKAYQGPGSRYIWSLPAITLSKLTLSFDASFTGAAGQTILTDGAWQLVFIDGCSTSVNTIVANFTTQQSCAVVAPTLAVSATPIDGNPCRYLFQFTLTKGSKNIKVFSIMPMLDSGFGAPVNITPANNPNTSLPPQLGPVMSTSEMTSYLWLLNGICSPTQSVTATFEADYNGPAGKSIFYTQQIPWKVIYTDGEVKEQTPVTNTSTTSRTCPIPPVELADCCESCSSALINTITLNPCDDYAEIDTNVTVAPRGRKMAVNLNLPEVCDQKDVTIGIYVTEVLPGGEVPYAHKVIRRSATTNTGSCKDDRDCNCVEFFVDDDDACSSTRTFNVRATAHYLDTDLNEMQQCPCNCSLA